MNQDMNKSNYINDEKEIRIAIPNDLIEYVRIRDGELILKKEVPNELLEEFNKFKDEFEKDFKKFKENSILENYK